MTRLNLMLFLILILLALSAVNAQHQARKLYTSLQAAREVEKVYEEELTQLSLEQSTWAMHGRIEEVSIGQLQMHIPDEKRTQMIHVSNAPVFESPAPQSP